MKARSQEVRRGCRFSNRMSLRFKILSLFGVPRRLICSAGSRGMNMKSVRREAETRMVREAAASANSPPPGLHVDSFSLWSFGALGRLGGEIYVQNDRWTEPVMSTR